MSKFEIVERPAKTRNSRRRVQPSSMRQTLMRTAESGKAVFIAANGIPISDLRNRWSAKLSRSRDGYRVVTRIDHEKDGLFVWAEKVEDMEKQPPG